MGGKREVSIASYRPVTRSDLKQELSFLRGCLSTFLQLVVAEVSHDEASREACVSSETHNLQAVFLCI